MSPTVRPLTLDLTGLTAALLDGEGPEPAEIAAMSPAALAALDAIMARRASGEIGFLDLPDDRAVARACLDQARP